VIRENGDEQFLLLKDPPICLRKKQLQNLKNKNHKSWTWYDMCPSTKFK